MLRELHIRNFAVVESLDLEFGPGMTVFTGETGAGKSIIVDAMGLILGDRADSSVVRDDQSKTEISAVFNVANNPTAKSLLEELEIAPEDDEIIIRRVVHPEGRSRGFINGLPAPVQQLKQLGESLVELHGQHSHQSLLRTSVQRDLLDSFGDHQDTLHTVFELYRQWTGIRASLQQLSGSNEDREARLALLEYQVQELDTLALDENEFTEVEAAHKRLSHINELLETVASASAKLCEVEESALTICSSQLNALQRLQEQDTNLDPMVDLLNTAVIQLQEAGDGLRDYLDHLDTDPERMAETERRLDQIHEIARKHHVRPEALYEHAMQLRQDLDILNSSEEQHRELLKKEEVTLQQYRDTATLLSKLRNKTAKKLSREVSERLRLLGMPAAKFEVRVEFDVNKPATETGLDQIEFLFTANPGQSLKPLTKVASGGELSRLSLAIQVTSTNQLATNSLVFDEVDSGIGGATAETVGKMLQDLANSYQVFCVTHLAQVAAFGSDHFHVSKMAGNNVTRTQVRRLDENTRVEEIARMMGGARITEQSLAHAREMLGVPGDSGG